MSIIFQKEYDGFESLADMERDIFECFDPRFNPDVKEIPDKFEGTVKVTIEYTAV